MRLGGEEVKSAETRNITFQPLYTYCFISAYGRSRSCMLQGANKNQNIEPFYTWTLLYEYVHCSSGRHREEDALELREARRRNRAQGLSESDITGGLYTSKRERLEIICQSEEYRTPCSPGQKWECVQDMNR